MSKKLVKADGKGEIEQKLDSFITGTFIRFNLNPETDCITRECAKKYMQELMVQQGNGDAWDVVEFDELFDLFEEDEEGAEKKEGEQEGLDKSEFTKLVKRIAQL